jgi:hypothetical protein
VFNSLHKAVGDTQVCFLNVFGCRLPSLSFIKASHISQSNLFTSTKDFLRKDNASV